MAALIDLAAILTFLRLSSVIIVSVLCGIGNFVCDRHYMFLSTINRKILCHSATKVFIYLYCFFVNKHYVGKH